VPVILGSGPWRRDWPRDCSGRRRVQQTGLGSARLLKLVQNSGFVPLKIGDDGGRNFAIAFGDQFLAFGRKPDSGRCGNVDHLPSAHNSSLRTPLSPPATAPFSSRAGFRVLSRYRRYLVCFQQVRWLLNRYPILPGSALFSI
jgi:hypothetical protein